MNKNIPVIIILSLLWFISLPSAFADNHKSPKHQLTVGVFHNYPIIFEEDGSPTGFHMELLKSVAKTKGWELSYKKGTLNDVLGWLKTKEIDVGMSLMPTKERKEFADFSEQKNVILWGQVFIKTGRADIHNFVDLEGKKVGFISRGTSGKNFKEICEKLGVNPEFIKLGPYEEVAQALEEGRIDAGVFNNFQGFSYAKEYPIESTSILFKPTPILFAVPKGENSYIIEAIDDNIRQWQSIPDSVYYQLEEEFLHSLTHRKAEFNKFQIILVVVLCLLFIGVGLAMGSFLSRFAGRSKGKNIFIPHLIYFTLFICLGFWIIDSVINHLFFDNLRDCTLWERIFMPVPVEIYTRSIFILICGIYGFFFARYLRMYEKIRIQAEESEEQIRLLLNSAAEGIYGVDLNCRCTFINQAAVNMLGYDSQESLFGKNMHEIVHGHHQIDSNVSQCRIQETFDQLDKIHINDETFMKADGTIFHVECWSHPVKKNNQLIGAVITFLNIDDRLASQKEKQDLQEKLQQAQKMEAIGTLAGGIAHDFNNILSVIMGYGEMVLADLEPESSLHERQKEIIKASLRAKDLVQQILSFSRQTVFEKIPIQINLIVKETVRMLRSTIPKTIEIRQDIEDCGVVFCDPSQLNQIVMNLCTNAFQAMPTQEGVIGVSLHLVSIESGAETLSIQGLNPGRYAKLEVSDTGQGMDKEVLNKIFEPYYTTKETGKGTGLGLAVVHGIVKSLDGHVSVYSEKGKGTKFCVYLPLQVAEAVKVEKSARIPDPCGDENILIVDDEDTIVTMEKEMLESLGYRIYAFSSVNDAWDSFQENPQKYDLVITDMTMPSMSGADFTSKLKSLRPNIPVILCTGFSELVDKEKAEVLGIERYLTKPITKHELAKAVREVLDKCSII